ncbi:hypothetical protein LOTGIDRAFT_209001 [Lottia gigantea]|uniref:Nucleoporin SEH1 n=1 Tax=Lottia gigantea TaxID=225164 RepID=V4C824_LOTGI|nr:hypothetical protein LOTGIDRAFT_209001 [Lottia gigantea]ESO97844.1 hypothetical protein LOTGIDRAFT_209001 [Lottia gigantea]
MSATKAIPACHDDLIHDVEYDFHGRRMATCSSDHTVKVWDCDENDQWKCTASWKAHSGSVWRVTWAHPEFGQVLATCSFDRTAAIWEELVGEQVKEDKQSHWIKRTSLVDSRTSVTDVKFAPRHLGLQLATCSADYMVRIYEAQNVMNLSQWSLQHEIQTGFTCSCLSWNPSISRLYPPMIAVGSDDPSPSSSGRVQIYEYNESSRKWKKVEIITVLTEPVHDLAFAPNLGRSYHTLAVASKDLSIFSLKPIGKESSSSFSKFDMHRLAEFTDHESQVWRLSWNVLGTVLSSSGDDGCVRLWKSNYMGSWKCIHIINGSGNKTEQSKEIKTIPVTSNINQNVRFYHVQPVTAANEVVWH